MNLPDTLLEPAWYWAAWAVWVPVLAFCIWRAPWSRLGDSSSPFNLGVGMVVLLALLWSLEAGIRPGPSLHLLGASVLTLCFGSHLAFIGLTLVLAGVTANGSGGHRPEWVSSFDDSRYLANK